MIPVCIAPLSEIDDEALLIDSVTRDEADDTREEMDDSAEETLDETLLRTLLRSVPVADESTDSRNSH